MLQMALVARSPFLIPSVLHMTQLNFQSRANGLKATWFGGAVDEET